MCVYILVLLLHFCFAPISATSSIVLLQQSAIDEMQFFTLYRKLFLILIRGIVFASRVPRQPIRHTISVISFSFSGLLYFLCIYSHSHIPLSIQFRRLLGAPLSFHCDFNSITAHDCHYCCCYCCCGMMLLLFLCFITITVRLPLLTCCCCRTFYSYACSTFCPLEVIPEGY